MNDALRDELLYLRDLGFSHLDLASASTAMSAEEPAPSGRSSGAIQLAELASSLSDCTRCRLSAGRTQVVFGVGSPDADLMFVGEAPGRDEDLQGEPFVGRAGQLLTDIIKAMKLTREQVYIANVVKCRPPENRNPEADELDACRPFIRRQIEIIQPRVIVTLGRYALQSLTEKGYAISSVRGQWLDLNGIRVMPTYHPAYLLRNPSAKKEVWADMKKVMSELGISA
ncbi:MAG TPA: uracil-DNA glycosylase [Thermoanaerobaculia bacterium]|nr:uracil-DNA glycosylase [Thermoanaerobaculia bacterium]